MSQQEEKVEFKRELGLVDAALLAASGMIGSGIFIVSADVTRNVGSAGWLIIVWLIGGFMTLTAAVSYGELSGMYPKAGGQYVYLKEAYGRLVAFLYGWSLFTVIQTGTIAAVCVSFFKFLAYFFPIFSEDLVAFQLGDSFKVSPAQLSSIVLLFLLTYLNTKGVKLGKIVQSIFTSTKLLSLLGLTLFGFIYLKPDIWQSNWSEPFHLQQLTKAGNFEQYADTPALWGAIAAALVGTVISYDAWNNVTFVAGEIKNPKRNIGLSLLIGTAVVTFIYVSINLMFTAVLPIEALGTPEKDRVGIVAAQAIFGASGTAVIAILILISSFGCANGMILAGARVYYSMAQDGLFFNKTGELNKNAVPEYALWLQFLVAVALSLSGRYGDLLDMISFVVVIFYVLTIAAIYVLRKKEPTLDRPYKAWGYPILPAIYILMGLAFCTLLIIYKPTYTWPGLIIAGLGVPVYYWVKK
ncbi:APA family basic amino acid/polyamine antiporter [Runella defluvii]|uniref:APA family basic amino acid/polyamine antiporter n=1 Tax=Runella defluvii TaxID=370973 RepID=A0A7W6ERU4_9BACT|nr:amino acid permease [Runella defluvii]MBB3839852.1 APA family basic amino acid/polyamine antiporter [Runella defluvii]